MRPLLAAVIVLFVAASAAAQTGNLNDYYIDFAVPDTPALGLFGLSPAKISRPGNLKELGVDVLPLATGGAKIGSGVAFSWAPVYTFAGSVSDYKSGLVRRLALSVATTKDSKSDAITLGVGVRVMLLDKSNPLLDDTFNTAVLDVLTKSLKGPERRNDFTNKQATPVVLDVVMRMTPDTLKQAELMLVLLDSWNIMAIPPGTTPGSQFLRFQRAVNREANPALGVAAVDLSADMTLKSKVEALAKAYTDAEVPPPVTSKAKLAELRKNFLESRWQAPVISVDVGGLTASQSGTWGDLAARQFGSAFLAAVPAGKSGQLVMQVQGRRGIGDAATEDWFYSAGGRLLLGNATKRFSIESLFAKARTTDVATNGTTKRLTVGTEFRVAQSFWVEIALGSEWTPKAPQNKTSLLSLAALKYTFKTKPRFTEIPGVNEE